MRQQAIVSGGRIGGRITPPPSKSAAHRALLCAALAGGGAVTGILPSEDMRATLRGIEAMGLSVDWDGWRATVASGGSQTDTVDCGESGSTLRFLIPIFAALGQPVTFTGKGRLPSRPLDIYADLLPKHGVSVSGHTLPMTISGKLTAGEYALAGNVSSQFITGLLYALPLCDGDSYIRLTTPLESAGYVDMTESALKTAGIIVEPAWDNGCRVGWRVPGNQTYKQQSLAVEADWSQAAFLLVAGILGGDLTIDGLDITSAQGDRAIVDILTRMGADITSVGGSLSVKKGALHGTVIDASDVPDLVPILAATAATAAGETRIVGAERVRLKESDRLAAMRQELAKLGADITETPDGLIIRGVPRLIGSSVCGHNDHRIVMSLAIASLNCDGDIVIDEAESVAKSWPEFFEDFNRIGGMAHVVNLG